MQRATFLTGSESWSFTFMPFSVKVKSPKKFVFAVFQGFFKYNNRPFKVLILGPN